MPSQKIDAAQYVSDTIADGQQISAGQRFSQVWRIRNTGETTWQPGYTLSCVSEERLGAMEAVPLPAAQPGEEVDVAVTFAAPPNEGLYRSTWKPRNLDGAPFGDSIWVEIAVPSHVIDTVIDTGIDATHQSKHAGLAAQKIGLDANAPLNVETCQIYPQVADPTIIAQTGVGWVRLNFILGQKWTSPTDEHRIYLWWGTWAEVYRHLIDGFRREGLKIYALIGYEAVHEELQNELRMPPEDGAAALSHWWIDQYVNNFVAILRLFRDDLEVVESFNEPDDWHGIRGNWIHPEWFAILLQRIYERVHYDPEINHIKLVSGPLQGLTTNQNGAADYLARTYAAGQARFGWGAERPFPFDGVGYHIYVEQGFTTNRSAQDSAIQRTYGNYIRQIQAVIQQYENQAKPLYISEMGWFTNGDDQDLHEEFQAANIVTALELLLHDPEIAPQIAFVSHFCTQDFDGDLANKFFGLYRREGLAVVDRKPAYETLKAVCSQPLQIVEPLVPLSTGQDDAMFVSDRIADGSHIAVNEPFYNTWTVRNSGTTTWTTNYRLVWIGGERLGAPPSVSISVCEPGQEISVSINFKAPDVLGPVESYWRLADPQGRLFGQQLWVKINVFEGAAF